MKMWLNLVCEKKRKVLPLGLKSFSKLLFRESRIMKNQIWKMGFKDNFR